MKPIIILPPDSMSDADIAELRANDICVVVAKEPAKVEFVDAIPAISSRTDIENAAIRLSRKVLNWGTWSSMPDNLTRTGAYDQCIRQFVDILVHGTPLDPKKQLPELMSAAHDEAKIEEARKIGREEAREERAAQKAKGAKK